MTIWVSHFFSSASTTLALISALFFFRFWRRTRDRFFAIFGSAFVVLTLHYAVLNLAAPDREGRPFLYAMRALAFLLITIAIIDKNRARR